MAVNMKDGFIKVAAATPKISVADCNYNTEKIIEIIEEAEKEGVKILTLPELCITGYTCGELFLQEILLSSAIKQLEKIINYTKGKEVFLTLGMPLMQEGKLFNVAAVIQNGQLLGLVPKKNIPNYSEFYEARHFNPGNEKVEYITVLGYKVPLGTNILFRCGNFPSLTIGVEICEDLWVPISPSQKHAMAGATVILNCSASNETTGKDIYRRDLVKMQSAKLICGYIYSSSGEGESTTDVVFSGHNLIAENGTLLKQSKRFTNEMIISELDIQKLTNERRRMTTYTPTSFQGYEVVEFNYNVNVREEETILTRRIDKAPFVPDDKDDRHKRCEEIINIQAFGLKKRLEHTKYTCVVLAISGGLDSTLALLVTCKAFDLLGLDRKGILTVTMPCFGTTDRTYQNALSLAKGLGTTLMEIRIEDAVIQHFKDIGHDSNIHDITYENSQARERTQVIMDLSNKYNGLVIGTGDMSELALGWATYNGDHMSMYGVNASVPKTLVRYLVSYFAENAKDELNKVLLDILDTPVSPELIPPVKGVISQKTEDLVGPYELHDFFMYYILRFGFTPSKIYRLALLAFDGIYEKDIILKWLKVFYRRFFSQQFKRSCLPDGPKVGSVAVSPRGDLRMPSDASAALWLEDLENIK